MANFKFKNIRYTNLDFISTCSCSGSLLIEDSEVIIRIPSGIIDFKKQDVVFQIENNEDLRILNPKYKYLYLGFKYLEENIKGFQDAGVKVTNIENIKIKKTFTEKYPGLIVVMIGAAIILLFSLVVLTIWLVRRYS